MIISDQNILKILMQPRGRIHTVVWVVVRNTQESLTSESKKKYVYLFTDESPNAEPRLHSQNNGSIVTKLAEAEEIGNQIK